MAYATAQDLVSRFGQAEIMRLSVPEGQPQDVIDIDACNVALADSSAVIDSYLRRRYLTPVVPTPQELTRACCILARYDMAHGDATNPTTQIVVSRNETIKWLEALRDGTVLLADGTPAGAQSYGQVQDAGCPVFNDGSSTLSGTGYNPPDSVTFWYGGLGGT
jgi:phage gp36-like protein